MAPCDLERRETVGDISISMYRTWPQFGGGYEVVARNGTELERIHTRSLPMADETFAMLVGKYRGQDSAASETMYAFARQDAAELRAWAGRALTTDTPRTGPTHAARGATGGKEVVGHDRQARNQDRSRQQ